MDLDQALDQRARAVRTCSRKRHIELVNLDPMEVWFAVWLLMNTASRSVELLFHQYVPSPSFFGVNQVLTVQRIAAWFCLLSPDNAEQQRAIDTIFKNKDMGKAFLRGGWKEDPKAEEMGRDVSLEGGEKAQGEGEGAWYEQGSKAMEKVVEGLSAF